LLSFSLTLGFLAKALGLYPLTLLFLALTLLRL
jgi:hypothetical protein